MRLQRHLAQCGVASRRRAEEIIAAGRVRVNGRVVRELGTSVDPATDRVEVDGKRVEPQAEREVWMLHKPKGVVTTMRDPERRKTVAQLVKSPGRRLVPVGRLDVQTTGLLLMTDDGDLAHRLMHPSWSVEKEYLATVKGTPGPAVIRRLCDRVELEGGEPAAFVSLEPAKGFGPPPAGHSRWLGVVHEGRHHLVRRMFEAVEHPATALHRTRVGPLELGLLKRGKSRQLTPEEISALRGAVQLTAEDADE